MKIASFFILLILISLCLTAQDFSLIGYAAVEAEGVSVTTGGEGGDSVLVLSGEELQAAINNKGENPLIIYIDSELTHTDKVDIKDVSDISILGTTENAELKGFGIYIRRASNIIIRNIKVHHVLADFGDAIGIDESHHVWIDHCELFSDKDHDKDYYDGLLDIKHGARYITISWNDIHDHYKTSLIGNSDNEVNMETDTMMKVSYHHNYFHNTNSRNPSVRFGKVHLFNNYFQDISEYVMVSRKGARLLIEGNHFYNCSKPVSTTFGDPPDGFVCLKDNLYTGTTLETENDISQTDCSWIPPYPYSLGDISSLDTLIRNNCGTGILDFGEGEQPNILSSRSGAPGLVLKQNYPNPFAGNSEIGFTLPEEGSVKLIIMDLEGRVILNRVDDLLSAGEHSITISSGNIKPGLYIYSLHYRNQILNRILILSE